MDRYFPFFDLSLAASAVARGATSLWSRGGGSVSLLLIAATLCGSTGCGGGDDSADEPPRAPIEVSSASFRTAVLDRPTVPVLVEFWAGWCAPCRAMEPTMATLALRYSGRAVVVRMDFDEETKLAAEYKVRSLPAYLIFKDGALVETLSGVIKPAEIEAKLATHMPPIEADSAPDATPVPSPTTVPVPAPVPVEGGSRRGG